MTAVLPIHSGNRAYTFFGHLVQKYKDMNVISCVAAFNTVLCVMSLMSLH